MFTFIIFLHWFYYFFETFKHSYIVKTWGSKFLVKRHRRFVNKIIIYILKTKYSEFVNLKLLVQIMWKIFYYPKIFLQISRNVPSYVLTTYPTMGCIISIFPISFLISSFGFHRNLINWPNHHTVGLLWKISTWFLIGSGITAGEGGLLGKSPRGNSTIRSSLLSSIPKMSELFLMK